MDLSAFDWPRWLNSLNWVLREKFHDDFTTTFLPLFKAAPPPSPKEDEMILLNALCGCNFDQLRDFLFSVASRDPKYWRNIFEWGRLETMYALQALERDMNRLPMHEYFDIPDQAAEAFDRFKTTREQALTLFTKSADDVFPKDGDKSIRIRVAKFLITNPVKWEYDDWLAEIDGEEVEFFDDDSDDEEL